MSTRTIKRILAGSGALALVSGGSIVAVSQASGSASPPPPPKVSAISAGSPAAVPSKPAAGLKDAGADPSNARAISTSSGTWYLAPSSTGACLATEEGDITCAPSASISAGTFDSIVPHGSTRVGGRPVPSGSATFRGIVPDGATTVQVIDKSGAVVGSGAVAHNAYQLDVPDITQTAGLRVITSDGSSQTADLRAP